MNESSIQISRARVVKDPELKYNSKGKPFMNLRLAYTGNQNDIFINALISGKAAESFKLEKGDLIGIHGDLEESVWQAQGQEKRMFFIKVSKIFVLKKKNPGFHGQRSSRSDDFIPEDIDI